MYLSRPAKIIITIEARMTSTRLPGKVLLPLGGKAALQVLIERLKMSRYADAIVVATTINAEDDPIVALCERLGAAVFRGSEDDVLGRVLGAARSVQGDIIVEITADCPLMDARLVDRGIQEFFDHAVDYAANIISPTFPNGFDVQVFPVNVLAQVSELTQDPIDRVHVSYYIYHHPERFRLYNWEAPVEARAPELRVTLDERPDYLLLDNIVSHFVKNNNHYFSAAEVVEYLKNNPEILTINQHVSQKDPTQG